MGYNNVLPVLNNMKKNILYKKKIILISCSIEKWNKILFCFDKFVNIVFADIFGEKEIKSASAAHCSLVPRTVGCQRGFVVICRISLKLKMNSWFFKVQNCCIYTAHWALLRTFIVIAISKKPISVVLVHVIQVLH